VVETTRGKKPPSFKIGANKLIRGLEDALIGLESGDKKKVKVPPEKGFGKRREELKDEVSKSIFKKGLKLSKDMLVELKSKDGKKTLAIVRSVKKDTVLVDLNHPFAGRTLNFDVKVVGVSTN
jgi:FKBP-type peptidyl-prolyl cis-trans isomerase 2